MKKKKRGPDKHVICLHLYVLLEQQQVVRAQTAFLKYLFLCKLWHCHDRHRRKDHSNYMKLFRCHGHASKFYQQTQK